MHLRDRIAPAAAISFALFVVTTAVLVKSYHFTPSPSGVSGQLPDSFPITTDFKVVAYYGFLSFHNQDMPYTGSVSFGRDPVRDGSIDFPGVYYRHFKSRQLFPHGTYWTFTIWLEPIVAVTALLPIAWLIVPPRHRDPSNAQRSRGFTPIIN